MTTEKKIICNGCKVEISDTPSHKHIELNLRWRFDERSNFWVTGPLSDIDVCSVECLNKVFVDVQEVITKELNKKYGGKP